MRYFKRSLAIGSIILIAVIVFFVFSVNYRDRRIDDSIVLTTAAKNTENTTERKRILIAENKEGNYQIYYDNETVYLVHDGIEKEFKGWTAAIHEKDPEMYYKDYDGDGEKELLVKLVSGVDRNVYKVKTYVYNIYLFKPIELENGKMDYQIIGATSDTWRKPFEEAIRSELTQLKSCNKFLQFVMDDADTPLTYDSKTGISKNKHVAFVSALSDNKKKYYTFSNWSRGKGVYEIKENGDITLDIEVLANYEEVDSTQTIGDIHCDIAVLNGEFAIVPKTIYFEPREGFKVLDPRDTADKKWSYVIKNSSTSVPAMDDGSIDWIDTRLELSSGVKEKSVYLGEMQSEIKAVDSIKFNGDSIVLTAKAGYHFMQRVINNGTYSVTISKDGGEFDVSYSASVSERNDRSVLTIKLDKRYKKSDLNQAQIKFGV